MFVQVLFVFFLAYAHGLQVNTTEGIVEGSRAVDGDYFAFYGVPYAGPTSGQNRFKMPMPPKPFPGVFRATDSNIFCAQPSSRGLIGIEDCLTLSIFTRNVTSPKPVVVFLNSDEYTNTNNQPMSYRRLVEQNIVFVTMNFRLSIFGFLCLGVQEAPGNAGLKDVLQGLKWIKSNIANFGGDPNNVILMGHASGGALVDLLTLSPQIENLAHKAIVLSGSALAPWAVGYDPVGYANLLGTKLEYDHKTPQVLAQRLINTDINVLHTALNDFKFFNNTPLFAPCVENPKLSPNHTVLGDAPINILRSGKYVQIPVIYGYTNREGTMRAEEADFGNWLTLMQTNFTSFLQVDLKLANNKTAVAASIRDFYFGSSAISMGTIEDFLDYQGDTLVLVSTIRGAKERALTSKSEVRLMEFAYLGTLNSNWIHNQIPLSGAAHGAFLNYLFGYDLRPADEAVSRALVGRVSAFAYNWSNNTWAAITKDSTNYLYYGGNGAPTANNTSIYVEEPRFNPHVQRMSFWNNLYEKFYVAPTQPSSANIIVSSLLFIMLCQMALRLY